MYNLSKQNQQLNGNHIFTQNPVFHIHPATQDRGNRLTNSRWTGNKIEVPQHHNTKQMRIQNITVSALW
jgi:hypothetical protein